MCVCVCVFNPNRAAVKRVTLSRKRSSRCTCSLSLRSVWRHRRSDSRYGVSCHDEIVVVVTQCPGQITDWPIMQMNTAISRTVTTSRPNFRSLAGSVAFRWWGNDLPAFNKRPRWGTEDAEICWDSRTVKSSYFYHEMDQIITSLYRYVCCHEFSLISGFVVHSTSPFPPILCTIPRGFTLTWWRCCGLCLWYTPTEHAHSFLFCARVYFCTYVPFHCI